MDTAARDRGLRYSLFDGAFASMMGSLAGGVFLMGFALKVLHATALQVGLLASLPLFANIVQMLGSYIIEKTGRKKRLCTLSVVVSRALWVLVILIPMAVFGNLEDYRVLLLVGIIAVSSLFGSLAGVAWLAWMSDLVPPETRGSYFGRRNMIASFAGMIITVAGGRFLTLWNNRFSESSPFGYVILFAAGLVFGMISSWFVSRMPETESLSRREGGEISLGSFLRPLRDRNFLSLILFVSVWTFGVQIAGPFYNVYMINYLGISFSSIALLTTLSTLTTLLMMKIWGPISDSLGNRPVITVASWVLIAIPVLWIAAVPRAAAVPLVIALGLSGAFMAGASLSQFNILIKLSPQQGRSIFLALFAAITGLSGAVAPIVGGVLVKALAGVHFTLLGYPVTDLHLVFLLSSAIQLIALFFLIGVHEPKASTPLAVILQLRNDLNPQTGIASTADFVLVELKKGRSLLKELDERTERISDRSENAVSRLWDKATRAVGKPVEKLRDSLKDDED